MRTRPNQNWDREPHRNKIGPFVRLYSKNGPNFGTVQFSFGNDQNGNDPFLVRYGDGHFFQKKQYGLDRFDTW